MATLPTQSLEEGTIGAESSHAEVAGAGESPRRQPSFREVYAKHFGFVWRYASNRGVPAHAMDEVVQEAFLVVHQRLGSFEGRSSLRTWVAGITRNVVRDYLRKRRNGPTGDAVGDEASMPPASTTSPVEALEKKVAVELLDQLLNRMTELQREVFILYEIEQFSAVEISEALEVNENTIRTRLRAARQIFNAGVARWRAQQAWRDR